MDRGKPVQGMQPTVSHLTLRAEGRMNSFLIEKNHNSDWGESSQKAALALQTPKLHVLHEACGMTFSPHNWTKVNKNLKEIK